MSANISKWFPKAASQHNSDKVFGRTKSIERELKILANKFTTNINFNLLDYYAFQMLLEQGKIYFQESCLSQYKLYKIGASSTDKNVERSMWKVILNRKTLLMRTNMRRRHFQLLFIISKTIKQMLFNGVFEAAFHLSSLFNNILQLTSQYTKLSSGSLVVSNTFPCLLSKPKRMDITSILQLVTRYRTESCCASLISCLLANCRADLQYDDNDSDTSSLQIFHALTKELSNSEELMQHSTTTAVNEASCKEIKSSSTTTTLLKPATIIATANDDPAIDFFDKLTIEGKEKKFDDHFVRNVSTDDNNDDESELLIELIRAEEIFIAHIIAKCLKFCPSAFEGEITKREVMSLIEKASRFLWTHVSGTLEHFVLWWNAAPLACRPVGCTKYLRECLLMQSDDAPEPILSTLKSLGEILTIHVIGCLWDKQFRNCLVLANNKPDQKFDRNSEFFTPPGEKGTTCGYFWSELLQSLVTITNSCDRLGTIANELPLTEQIPVLHRLDHSIHTMRLWTVTRAKELCSDWNMRIFFQVVHNDMERCLEHLNDLRLPELVCTNPLLEVHINVNVALREKLVSEVKTNRDKAKKTTNECISNVFAYTCEQTSLAALKIYFPPVKIWRANHLKAEHNQYIDVYLDIIYLPIIEATKDLEILSLALKIIGEALLEHIYAKRIKFTICGAINLMKDFDGIAAWIEACEELPANYRDKLSKHEVLKVCEGVGKILLRQPDEIILLHNNPHKPKEGEKGSATDDDDERANLPPEMYINQQKWLELRATRKSLISCLCNNVNIIS